MASVEGKNDMAVGNAIGSVTANTGLIMGIAFVFMTVVATRKNYWKQCALLLSAALILWLGSLQGSVALWACAVLAVIFTESMAFNVFEARRQPAAAEKMTISKKT